MSGQLALQSSDQDPAVQKSLDFFNKVFAGAPVKPFAIRLWNGFEWQHCNEPPQFTLELKHPAVLRRMFWRPSELSLGEAFILDDLDIHGDLEASFDLADYLIGRHWRMSEKLLLGRKLLRLPGKHPARKGRDAVNLQGRTHSKQRDAQAVQYHYNLSNDFYRLWLDQRMVYSCAFFHSPDDSLDEAQYRKLDYICRKLRLKPGKSCSISAADGVD